MLYYNIFYSFVFVEFFFQPVNRVKSAYPHVGSLSLPAPAFVVNGSILFLIHLFPSGLSSVSSLSLISPTRVQSVLLSSRKDVVSI